MNLELTSRFGDGWDSSRHVTGLSMDSIFRQCAYWLPRSSYSSIVVEEPSDLSAVELIGERSITHVDSSVRRYKKDFSNPNSFWKGWHDKVSPELHAEKVGRAIRALGYKTNCTIEIIKGERNSPVDVLEDLDMLGTGVWSPSLNNREPLPTVRRADYMLPCEREEYNNNKQTQIGRLHYHGWLDAPLKYTLNEYNFRTQSMSRGSHPTGGVLCLGCSYTVGYGVDDSHTWPSRLSHYTKMPAYNLGVLGGSNDTIYRLAHSWIDRMKPEVVVALFTHEYRRETFHIDEKVPGSSFYMSDPHLPNLYVDPDKFYVDWMSNEYNAYFNYLQNSLALEDLCRERNIPLISFPISSFNEIHNIKDGCARDLAHPGPFTLDKFVQELVLPKLKAINI